MDIWLKTGELGDPPVSAIFPCVFHVYYTQVFHQFISTSFPRVLHVYFTQVFHQFISTSFLRVLHVYYTQVFHQYLYTSFLCVSHVFNLTSIYFLQKRIVMIICCYKIMPRYSVIQNHIPLELLLGE